MGQKVNHIVSQLLLNTNCVVIQGLGGFVANPIAAKVDYARGLMIPPSKALTFNSNLTNNDGLLVTEVAKNNALSYENALEHVFSFAKKSSHALKNGERVGFPNVGFLFLNEAGKIAFEQDRFFNLLLSSYGLGQVEFIPEEVITPETEVEQTASIPATTETPKAAPKAIALAPQLVSEKIVRKASVVSLNQDKTEEASVKSGGIKKLLRYAAVAALTPIAFYSFWIPMKTDVLQSGIVYKEDFNPFKLKSEESYFKSTLNDLAPVAFEPYQSLQELTQNMPDDISVYSFGLTDDIFIPVRIREEKQVISETTSQQLLNKNTDNTKNYFLIAGAFGEISNARSFVKKLKDQGYPEAQIIDQNKGLHRVAISSSDSRKAAKKLHDELKNNAISSWILSK